MVYLLWMFYINKVMEYVAFCFCHSLDKVFKVDSCFECTSLFSWLNFIVLERHIGNMFIHYSFDGHAGCFCFFRALSIYVYILQELVFSSLRYIESVITCQ